MATKSFSRIAKEQTQEFLTKLSQEPLVAVEGGVQYRPHFGDVLSFTFNGLPITIVFDGSVQMFRKSVAEEIKRKLRAFSENSVSLNTTDQL